MPRRIACPDEDLPLYGSAASRAVEQAAVAGLPPHALMRRAGASVARLALALAPHARLIWIAAGPGNNGGDGLHAAIHLKRAGKAVAVTLAGSVSRLPPDARDACERAYAAGIAVTMTDGDSDDSGAGGAAATPTLRPAAPQLGSDDLAIDALLGLGSNRAPSASIGVLVDALNDLPCPVLAVDLPSGLNADTGQSSGDAEAAAGDTARRCVRAQHTLALLTAKPGLHTGIGRDQAGTVWLDELGVDPLQPRAPDAWLTGAARVAALQPGRRHAQHKGSFGDVAVLGGTAGMTGAALLAARAAHAAGAGRVWLSLLDPVPLAVDSARPELMWRERWWETSSTDVLRRTAVVCGCGGGSAVAAVLPRLLDEALRLVLDADALNAVAASPALRARLEARAGRHAATVLTPHPLEAARLLDMTAGAVQADRLAAARALAQRTRCIVVLKGSGTVIAAPGMAPFVNPTGNAALATAGTGDVLAGWLGGLWSQHDAEAAFDVALAAVHRHGAAADRSMVAPLRAADLIEAMMAADGRGAGRRDDG